MQSQPQTYTAKIGRNFRDVGTLSPKVLLRDVIDSDGNLFRDHCWVELSYLAHVVPNSNRYSAKISFKADTKIYYSGYGFNGKYTLTSIDSAKYLGKIK